MATSQPMVPTGQPYGDRKQTVANMQAAGVPLAPTQQPSSPVSSMAPPANAPSPAGSASAGLPFDQMAFLSGHTPDEFPFLTAPPSAPTAAAPSAPDSPYTALAASAQSDFARAVMARLQTRTR